MNYDGILFDLDGTLWDSCENVARAWQELLCQPHFAEQRPAPAVEEVRSVMGLRAADIAKRLFSGYDLDPMRIFEQCAEAECRYLAKHGGTLFDGAADTLRLLAGKLPLFIVSNCQKGYIEAFLDFYGLRSCFQDHLSEGDTGMSKSENIKTVIKRNGLKKTVYIGDTEGDLYAAELAGIPFIHAVYGFGGELPCANHIQRLGELPAFLNLA